MSFLDETLDTASKIGSFAADVCCFAAAGAVKGTSKTLGTVADLIGDVRKGDFEKAGSRIEERVQSFVSGVGSTYDGAVAFCSQAADGASLEKLLTKKNARVAASVLTFGVAAAFAAHTADGLTLPDDDFDVGDSLDAEGGTLSQLPEGSVENGMFVGDASALQELIELGENADADHVDADDISRSMAERNSFLEAFGYDGVPSGYEVHHINPLSEGGADDADNMILVSESDHDAITAAHREFYGWNAG
jgi:hypothetical protein